ncbi:C-type lectin 37Da-like [Drosophila rhopaloa]|uniref:Macrophage mannose receptor 1-like n=1 Tax=Drosophila rhopaloa TaxID=1041015 RepID=A0A6P4EXA9_DRORH|nr:C-type lectin 37Da-like [Drosophila rhopaloa]
MLPKFTALCAFLAIFSSSAAYTITPNIIEGVPDFLNISTAPFVKIGSGYYIIESVARKNWYGAYESCRQLNAELITFESVEELKLITQYIEAVLSPTGLGLFWTSGNDLANQDKHVWFSNGQPVPSDLFAKGEPNNANDEERCDAFKVLDETNPGMNDCNCEIKRRYVCKAPQPVTASFIIF